MAARKKVAKKKAKKRAKKKARGYRPRRYGKDDRLRDRKSVV